MALMLIVLDTGFTPGYMAAPSMSRVVAMLADLPGGGRLGGGKSGRARWPSGNSTLGDVSFWSSEAPLLRDCGLPEADSPEGGAAPFAAAAAAAAARSLRDAFPRFLRSRMYSQVKPNSTMRLASVAPRSDGASSCQAVKNAWWILRNLTYLCSGRTMVPLATSRHVKVNYSQVLCHRTWCAAGCTDRRPG